MYVLALYLKNDEMQTDRFRETRKARKRKTGIKINMKETKKTGGFSFWGNLYMLLDILGYPKLFFKEYTFSKMDVLQSFKISFLFV